MPEPAIGVIGGSGLYEMEGLEAIRRKKVRTPFGDPSDLLVEGRLEGRRVVFLPRHGIGHRISPTELPFRANVWALKSLGVEWILSISAVGSMKEEIVPGHLVVVDQFIDRTRQRVSTFFRDGIVAHVAFADPVCKALAKIAADAGEAAGATIHRRGTYLCMEGPAFSTRAESHLYRSWGVHVIGMTNLQEAKLAREAEICYATIALATDYDCWHEGHADVDVAAILKILHDNAERAKALVREAVKRIPETRTCPCKDSLRHAILTAPNRIAPAVRRKLDLLIGKYLPEAWKTGAKHR
jgi:5'-methylthioadenosine phosphorylase